MTRPKKTRNCRRLSDQRIFKPIGLPARNLELIDIGLDEFEAMRLVDKEAKSQIEAAEKMNISRGTVQRLLNSGRKKLIIAILGNKAIQINKEY